MELGTWNPHRAIGPCTCVIVGRTLKDVWRCIDESRGLFWSSLKLGYFVRVAGGTV